MSAHLEPVSVRAVRGWNDLRRFIDLPYRLHAGTPWIPPLRLERWLFLNRRANAYFTHGRAQYFLARRGDRIVGRISAQVDTAFNEFHDNRWGMFGFLELEDDLEALQALLHVARGWLRERGCDHMIGPMDLSMNDESGVLIEGHELEPLVRQPWHPPYYQRLIEEAGLGKEMDLLSWDLSIDDRSQLDPRLFEFSERALADNEITIRPMSRKHMRREMDAFADVYNSAWSRNWGFVPYGKADLDAYALELKYLVNSPGWYMVAERHGETIGMAITVMDVNQVLKKMKGRLLPLGWWHFLRRHHTVDRLRVGFLGVKREYQHTGAGAALYVEHFNVAARSRLKKGEAGWILETNRAMNRGLKAMNGRVVKRYRVYGQSLGDEAGGVVSDGYRYDASAFREVFERSFGYLAGVERNSHRYATRPALHDPASGRRWTYAELWRDSGRLAAGLAAAGVGAGDVVVFQLFNCPEFALLWLAAQRLGAIASPINFRLSPGETAYVLDDSAPRAFVYDAALRALADDALARAGARPALVAVVGADGSGAQPFEQLLAAGDELPATPEDATIYAETTRLYTSGTTGLPKGVSLNSLVEVLSAHDVIMHFPLAPEDRTLNMTPWFHRGGLYSGGPNPVFYVGAESVPLRQFDAAAVLDLVASEELTFLIGAPTNLALLAAEQEARPRELGSLHGIVTMGAPLDRDACLRYQRLLTPRIFNGYGTTEAFWNTFLRPADLPEHAGSAGRACTDDDVAVVRVYEDRVAAPDDLVAKDGGEVGEVIVRSVKSGYAYVGQPAEQAARFRDGWLYIGDLATWDAEEYVTIVGRKDDMIISGGENIHPVQVEGALAEHPGVADAIVVGLPDERWGELVVAYVVRADAALTAADCEAHCHGHPMLAGYKRPRAYRFIDALPMTATGKKLHYQIREQAQRDAAAGLLERP